MSHNSVKSLGMCDLAYGIEKHLKKQQVNWVSISYISKISCS